MSQHYGSKTMTTAKDCLGDSKL